MNKNSSFDHTDRRIARICRILTTWSVAFILRLFSVLLWIAAVAAFLASMGVLLALDYDVDVGGGVSWANLGVRALIGIGLCIVGIPFAASGGFLWQASAKILSPQRGVSAGSKSSLRLLSQDPESDGADNPSDLT